MAPQQAALARFRIRRSILRHGRREYLADDVRPPGLECEIRLELVNGADLGRFRQAFFLNTQVS